MTIDIKAARESCDAAPRDVSMVTTHRGGETSTWPEQKCIDFYRLARTALPEALDLVDVLCDQLIQCKRERDEAVRNYRVHATAASIIERDTAEAIAAWLEVLMAAEPDDWSVTPADIRHGAWKVRP